MQERGEAINTTQRPDEQDPAAALDTLPDDHLLHIVVACGGEWLLGVPELHGRGERSWQPVQRCLGAALSIGYIPSCTPRVQAGPQPPRNNGAPHSLPVAMRAAVHGRANGDSRGRSRGRSAARARALDRRAPHHADPGGGEARGPGATWRGLLAARPQARGLATRGWPRGARQSAMFGEAAVCSTALLELQLDDCGLSGPLPELNLPALQILWLSRNQMSGGLEPLMRCTALQEIDLEPAKATFPWQLTLASCRDIGRIYNEHFTTYDVALWRRRGAWRGEVD
jgi:hypothetical protein